MPYSFNSEKNKIQSINLTITLDCNLNCRMCEINRHMRHRKYAVPDTHVFRLLSQYKSYNADGIVQFDAGEVFANKKTLYPFLLHCRKIGLKIGVVTNGTLVTEEDLDLLRGNLGYFIVSLDSHVEKIHDFVRGKGTFAKVIRLFELLHHKAIGFSVNTIVSRLNIDHLTELYGFLNTKYFFRRHDLNLLTKSYFAPGKRTNQFYKTYSFNGSDDKTHAVAALNAYMRYTAGRKTSYTPQVHACIADIITSRPGGRLNEPLCNVFKRKLIVDFEGDIRLCYLPLFPPLANITDTKLNLKEIWESETAQKIRSKMESCLEKCGKELCNNKRLPFNRI
jgi:MoaA/NifB/PqqE/SkfB family radical SAM enzyme